MTARVTTVIPTYRRPKLLARAIQSALNQTFGDIQILVCDNASGDETASVVERFRSLDSRVRYHCHPRNIGAPANFNFAIARVDTPFFSMLSDDDILMPRFYEAALTEFERYPQAMAVIGVTVLFDAGLGRVVGCSSVIGYSAGLYEGARGLLEMAVKTPPIWTGILFRQDAVRRVGLLREWMEYGDFDFMLRVGALCPYTVLHEPMAVFTGHKGSISAVIRPRLMAQGYLKTIADLAADERIEISARNVATAILLGRYKRTLLRMACAAIADGQQQRANEALWAICQAPETGALWALVLRSVRILSCAPALTRPLMKGWRFGRRFLRSCRAELTEARWQDCEKYYHFLSESERQ
jgi:glycosyltransferase involved in cell wall biosynthesis